NLHHRLWAHEGFFANSRTATAREYDYFHKCAPQTCGPVRPALSGSVARKLPALRDAHKQAGTLATFERATPFLLYLLRALRPVIATGSVNSPAAARCAFSSQGCPRGRRSRM